jgi:HD-like signal output (HDOD) protein/CheY-like chemotaxis protein
MTTHDRTEVLFVDDDPQVLDGLKRQFHARRHAWNLRFARSAADALRQLEQRPARVIVSDMAMPGSTGAALLREVSARWPGTVRFILSGRTDQAELLQDIGAVHQYLQKPCTPQEIDRAITRTMALADRVESGPLLAVATGLHSLPVMSQSFRDLLGVLGDDDSDAPAISRVVERDPGLSAKLLQMVNSAFFGLPRQTRSIREAVVLLGTGNLRALAVASRVFDALGAGHATAPLISHLWKVSADIGALAAKSAHDHARPPAACEAARLAGTLCLVGRAVLARHDHEAFLHAQRTAEQDAIPLADAEAAVFHAPQHLVGAYALGLWAFPQDIVESVMHQASPEGAGPLGEHHPLPFVHEARSLIGAGTLVERIPRAEAWLQAALHPAPALPGMEAAA